MLTRARVCEALWRHRDDDDQGQAGAQAILDEANAVGAVEEATRRRPPARALAPATHRHPPTFDEDGRPVRHLAPPGVFGERPI